MSQSQNISYNPRLDELRGIACILVFIAHGFGFFKILTKIKIISTFGGLGVGIFLSMSGYLFTTIFLNKKEEVIYKGFIYNRFLRIFPLFIVFMLFIITCYPSYFKADQLLYFFTLQWNIFFKSGTFSGELESILFVTWTIAVEFQFYLLFPFIFKFYKKYGIKYLYFLLVLLYITVIAIKIHPNSSTIYFSSFANFQYLIAGMLLAIYSKNSKKNFSIIFPVLIIFIIPLYAQKLFNQKVYILLALSLVIFIYFYLHHKKLFPKLYIPLQKLGTISYSFYLTHVLCIQVVLYIIPAGHRYISVGIAFILTILLSTLTYHTIEKPFMSLRKKY